jgi:hypothetical protein
MTDHATAKTACVRSIANYRGPSRIVCPLDFPLLQQRRTPCGHRQGGEEKMIEETEERLFSFLEQVWLCLYHYWYD